MKNRFMKYGVLVCAATLMMSTVACGHSGFGAEAPSNMSSGMSNRTGTSMSNSTGKSMNNTMNNSMGNGTK